MPRGGLKNILLGKIHKSRWIVSIDWGSKVAKISQCEFLAMTSFVTFAVGGWIGEIYHEEADHHQRP